MEYRKQNDKEPTNGYALLSCQLTSKCRYMLYTQNANNTNYRLHNNIENPFRQ